MKKYLLLLTIPAILIAQTFLKSNQLSKFGFMTLRLHGGLVPVEGIESQCRDPRVFRNGLILTAATDWPATLSREPDYTIDRVNEKYIIILRGQKSDADDIWRIECY